MDKKTVILMMLMVVMALNAASQVRLGVRGGLTLGEIRFDREIINSDNRVGYCGGLLLDCNIPVVGLGVEASVMYTCRKNNLSDGNHIYRRQYIDIPVYARYRLAVKGAEKIVAPLIFTGPSFSVLFEENGPVEYENSKTYLSWDLGAGVDLFKHLRVTVTHGIGISRAMKWVDREYKGAKVEGRDRCWTMSAAWMF